MAKLRPKKHLGQHFLHDPNTARRIVASLHAQPPQPVVEIGPGEGVLTQLLLERYPSLTVVEVDPDAVAHLSQRFQASDLHIIHEDVLRWRPDQTLAEPAAIIGNLPYNISSPIFFLLLSHRDWMTEGVFMIQKEVAERMAAKPGNKIYGVLSVLLQAYFHISYEFSVPPTVFRPPPKVMSGVIRMVPLATEHPIKYASLQKVVKAAFGQRRKTLRNALKPLSFQPFPEQTDWWSKRAEQLSVEEFIYLTQQLSQE